MPTERKRKPLSDEQRQAQYKASDKYIKNNIVYLSLKVNRNTDADILEHLNKQDNKQGYIKRIIREDIAREKKE